MFRTLTAGALLLCTLFHGYLLQAQESLPLPSHAICVSAFNGKYYILDDINPNASVSAARATEISKTLANEYIATHTFQVFCPKSAGTSTYTLSPLDTQARYLWIRNTNDLKIETTSNNPTKWTWDAINGRFISSSKTAMMESADISFKAYATDKTGSSISSENYWMQAEMLQLRPYADYTTNILKQIWDIPSLKHADLSQLTKLPANLIKNAEGYTPNNPNAIFSTSTCLNLPKNEVYNGVCSNLVLTDKYPFGVIHSFTAQQAAYTRDAWQDGEWETIVLPFDVSAANLPDGYKFDQFHSISPDQTVVRFVEATELKAHTPYLMRYAGTPENIQKPVTFKAEKVTIEPFNPNTNTAFKGVYTTQSGVGRYILGIKNGKAVFNIGIEDAHIQPFRAYIDCSQSTTNMLQMSHQTPHPTSLTESTVELLSLRYTGSELYITLLHPQTVVVASVSGQIYYQAYLPTGEHRLPSLPSGHYIINQNHILIP